MPMHYYDHTLGRERVKRRYVWALYAFAGGVLFGIIAAKFF